MKFINWLKNNYLIAILFIVAVWILVIKINIKTEDNTNNNLPKITPAVEVKTENKIDKLISPTLTTTSKTIFGNKTKEEILQMDPEVRYNFITELSREEVEELDMMPNYDFSDFLPYKSQNFIVEKFDYKNKKLTVKPLINDKTIIKNEISDWLYYENGNNPKKIEIIWNE